MATLTCFDTITPLLYRNTYLSRNNDLPPFRKFSLPFHFRAFCFCINIPEKAHKKTHKSQ